MSFLYSSCPSDDTSYFLYITFQKATGNDASENASGFINLSLLALATFSTAYNVVLYVIFNPSFRRAILGVLRCTRTSVLESKFEMERSPQAPTSVKDGDCVAENTVANSNGTLAEIVSQSEISLNSACTTRN